MPSRIGDDPVDLEELREILMQALRRKCSRRFESHFEDIVQRVLVKVVERSEDSSALVPVGPGYWVKAAHNALVDETRRLRSKLEGPSPPEHEKSWFSEEPGPDRAFQSKQIGAAIYDCLQQQVDARKQAVTLYLHGYSAKESGKVLHYPEKRVRNLVFRGLSDLRRCLSGKGIHR